MLNDWRSVERLVLSLPQAAQDEFACIIADAEKRQVMIDPEPIVIALLQANIVRFEPLPPKYSHVAAASGGRLYGLQIEKNPNPCNFAEMSALHDQYLDECRRVYALVERGISATDAWARVKNESRISHA